MEGITLLRQVEQRGSGTQIGEDRVTRTAMGSRARLLGAHITASEATDWVSMELKMSIMPDVRDVLNHYLACAMLDLERRATGYGSRKERVRE
jgi:hypothetical protein